MSEKTHPPTARRLEEARKQGQLPRSRLFTSAAATFGGLLGAALFADETVDRLTGWTASLLQTVDVPPAVALSAALRALALGSAPALAGAFLGGLGAAVLTTGGLRLQLEAIAPKLERLDPAQGAGRLLSWRQAGEVLRGLLVAALVGWFFWRNCALHARDALLAVHHGAAGLGALLALVRPLLVQGAALLLTLGVADWALARRRHRKDLMMSHAEVRQEHKSAEGDPHHKAKRRALHRQLASAGTARGVHKATAVIVNPTHLAVALRYDEAECDAPYIVAKGQEEDALKLRTEAAALGIPVVRDVPLARSLIHYDVGEEVPEELYQAAAALLQVALEASAARDAERGEVAP